MHFTIAILSSALLLTPALTETDHLFRRFKQEPVKDPPGVGHNDFFRMHLFTNRGDKTTFGFRFRARPLLPTLCLDVAWTRDGDDGRIMDFAPTWGVCKWSRQVGYPLFADGIDRGRSNGLSDQFYTEATKRAESELWPVVWDDIERGGDYEETLLHLYLAVQNWPWLTEELKQDRPGGDSRRRGLVARRDATAKSQNQSQNQKEAVGKPLKGESVNDKFVDQVKQNGHDLVHGTKEEKANMHKLCDRCFHERP